MSDILPKRKEPDAKMDVAPTTVPAAPKKKTKLKDAKDVICCVVDYGTFLCLAEKMSETFNKVYYYTPTSQEFYSISDLVKGGGLDSIERVNDIFDPDFIDEVDLFIFPDIGYGGLQKYFRSIGKAVWGSMGADALENIRTEFMKTLEKLKLPTIHTEVVHGLSNLREHLKGVENKWIKVDKYRGNMETWHHIDEDHSSQELDRLANEFGGLQDTITFLVQDFIKTDVEIGYDGWCIDGKFPSSAFQGYEKKDQLYVGGLVSYDKLPEQVRIINEALAPLLEEYGYRNFFATEIRVKDGVPYFIDPTLRMPGVTGEQLTETCANLAEVIWQGANGVMVEPDFKYKYATAAIMHAKGESEGWKILKVSDDVRRWVKMLHFCKLGDLYHFPPRFNDELGTLIGAGNTISKAVEALKEHYDYLHEEPVCCEMETMCKFIEEIGESEYGLPFSEEEIEKVDKILSDA